MTEGKYLYCIINENREKGFGCIGITNREVKLVPYKDIAAVVSNTPVINFDRLNKEELTKYVVIHQKVNEVVMSAKGGSAPASPARFAIALARRAGGSGGKEYDVVPMTFGIIAPGLNEVVRILEKAYLQFKTALKNIAGKAEFAVQVWWDPKKLLEELANTNPEIQKLKQKVALKGSIWGMPSKLKLGKLIQKEAEIQRQAFINDVYASLRNLSFDSTSNKLIDDKMIANLSFLIEKTKESELDKKMQELGKKYEGKLRFKYIGPMPPYSFAKINLSLGNFEVINEARKILGLTEEASFNEIKKAYYSLSLQYHPDKHPGDRKKEEQMKKIIKAYDILENYCQSYDNTRNNADLTRTNAENYIEQRGRQKYSFKKEDIENSITIH